MRLTPLAVALAVSGITAEGAGAARPSSVVDRSAPVRPAAGGEVASVCTAAHPTRHTSGIHAVPVILTTDGAGWIAAVQVCIAGAGPYRFVLDTGSSVSLVTPAIATRLHLPAAGPARQAAGVACSPTVGIARMSAWTLEGVPLGPQTVAVYAVPELLTGERFDGIIGSDVLSRFGTVRLDYRDRTLVLDGPEGPAPAGISTVPMGRGAVPAALARGRQVSVSATVVHDGAATAMFVPVELGSAGTQPFLVDTGARASLVSASLAASGGLRVTGRRLHVVGIGCAAELAEVRSGRWSIGGAAQPEGYFAVLPRSSPIHLLGGDLGSDVFRRYGAVVLDYREAKLVLAR
jgi:hypothetical protein